MNLKIGDKIEILEMVGEPQYTGKVGVVDFIDDAGQVHGTWGDFFSILDSASEANNARPWCKSWLCARKNDCGVYVENVQTFRQGEGYRRYVELKCALDYPRVYYACSIQDRISGRGSPLDADGDYCFDVFDGIADVEKKVRGYLTRCASGYEVNRSWIDGVVNMLKNSLQQ